jgi:hypothetical protein
MILDISIKTPLSFRTDMIIIIPVSIKIVLKSIIVERFEKLKWLVTKTAVIPKRTVVTEEICGSKIIYR